MVKQILRFPRVDKQTGETKFLRLKNPIVQVVIDNQRGKVMKLQHSLPFNGPKRYQRWVLVHPDRLERPTFIDGKRRKVPDMLKPEVEVKGEREAFDTRAEFDARLSRFTGPDFAADVIALLTLAMKELTDEQDEENEE